MKYTTIVIDGNDGTGKSTIVEMLRKEGYEAKDRGIPTKMTDDHDCKAIEGEFYIVLDASVETCQARLKKAGRSLLEKYHTIKDLKFYRRRFLEVAKQLKGKCVVIDSSKSANQVLNQVLREIRKRTHQKVY